MNGKAIRMKKLFRHSSNAFILPMDHGITLGPVQGLEDVGKVVEQVCDKVDAVLVHKGMVSGLTEWIGPKGCELVIHLSASTALSPNPNRKELVTSVEQAIRLGACAVSTHVNLGGENEASMLRDMGYVAERCLLWGMPLLAMMYVRDASGSGEYDAVKIQHAARVAEELGADVVKVNYTGNMESFCKVTGSVKIPVIVAGGAKMNRDRELLAMVKDAVDAGARGVAIGRNIFQHHNPSLLAGEIRSILDRLTATAVN